MRNRIWITTIVFLAGLVLCSATAYAKDDVKVAILPIQSPKPISDALAKEAYTALEKPLAERSGYSILPPLTGKKENGIRRNEISPAEEIAEEGKRLEADQVVACWLKVSNTKKKDRWRFDFALYYYDVKGGLKLKALEAECKACSRAGLGKMIAAAVKHLYAGPYNLGLDTKPGEASISHKGEVWGTTPISKMLPGGKYKILIEREGYKRMEVEFPMPADRSVYATLPLQEDPNYLPPVAVGVLPILGPAGAATPPPPKPEEPAEPEPIAEEVTQPEELKPEPGPEKDLAEKTPTIEQEMPLRRKWAWRSLGIGAAFAAGGLGLTFAALHADSRAEDTTLLLDSRWAYADRRDSYWIAAYTTYGLALAATVTSVVLFFTGNEADSAKEVVVAPALTPDGGGVTAMVRY